MESRKETLSSLKKCRFCLSEDETLTSLYKTNRVTKNAASLALKILSCISVEIYPSDKMPRFICKRCKTFINIFYEFKNICRQADENILHFVENGNHLESIPWPSSLIKVYQALPKQPEIAVMKTVVESGATVQLTAQELSDTDMEDDENVYNIKISEGSEDETKSARFKVITGSDKEDLPKRKCKVVQKGHGSVSKLARHVRSHAGDRSYPCKYCNKTFLKSHHYTRHLRVKHRDIVRNRRGPFDEQEQFRCDQCEDCFTTQDDLIYHSAIHATQNLICPLCQEKFGDVDAVTAHIKSHVNGTEFMCDYCELIFTTKEKLDNHYTVVHEDELRNEAMEQDESSMEVDGEDDDDDDNAMNVTEENGEMVVQIKKPDEFMISNYQGESEDRAEMTNSEESEHEVSYADLVTVNPADIVKKESNPPDLTITKVAPSTVVSKEQTDNTAISEKNDQQTASIIKKVEEMKRKVVGQKSPDNNVKKDNGNKMENNIGASDKSLRLLEKELQDLKRTNSRSELAKPTVKSFDNVKTRRLPISTSTPKIRTAAGKEGQQNKPTAVEKKAPERRSITTKECKEPKDLKDTKSNSVKEDKDKEVIEKETTKEKSLNVIKNGSSEKNSSSEEKIRRSTRPSKVKDYAKMIRDSSQESSYSEEESDEEDEDDDDEEFKEIEKIPEPRQRQRRASVKQPPPPKPATVVTTPTVPRKRGRPRKNPQHVAIKVKKEDEEQKLTKVERGYANSKNATTVTTSEQGNEGKMNPRENTENNPSTSDSLVSPSTSTLKKVPIKALPPGVKPLPLPANARLGSREVCEMQIGKKMVKVQKIVMTKAEVEAMAKKGLVELKDGTMVLKQGVNPSVVKSTLVSEGEGDKESASKIAKATPTRCDLADDI